VSDSGGTTPDQQARLRALAEAATRHREDRAAGRKRWRGAGAALRWYALTRESWASPKALTMRDEGSGAPSRGSDSPARRLFAAVAGAMKEAEIDDQERHPTKAAPLLRWTLEHFGGGRAFAWMAEESGIWSEVEIEGRMRRMCRVVRDHLRRGGWLEDAARDGEGA
jgi:hypothetical protein